MVHSGAVTGIMVHYAFQVVGISSSQLTSIFFRGVAQPPTSFGHLKSPQGLHETPAAGVVGRNAPTRSLRCDHGEGDATQCAVELEDIPSGYVKIGKPYENHRKTIEQLWFNGIFWDIPSGYVKIAIENGHINSGFSPRKW